jgi:superfamily I DNA and RNA helicase
MQRSFLITFDQILDKQMKYLIGIFFLAVVSSCIKRNDEPVNTGIVNTSASYKLSSYSSNGLEYNFKFAGNEFKFGNNDALQAIQSGVINGGKWRNTQDSIVITSFVNPPFDLLNGSWVKQFVSTVGIDLVRTSGIDEYKLRFTAN